MKTTNANKGRIGDIVELKAQSWLLEQGYEVFRNVSAKGPVDVIILDTDNKIVMVDVKKVVDKQRKVVKVNQPRLTEKQKQLGVKLLHYDEKKDVFAWDISQIRKLHNQSAKRPKAKETPEAVTLAGFESLAAMARKYDVNPRSLRERIRKGDTAKEAIKVLQHNSKKICINGLEFSDRKRACEHFDINVGNLDYWMYDKGETAESAINILLEKKK